MHTDTATRTATGLHVETADGAIDYQPNGKTALAAVAIVLGDWKPEFGGGVNMTMHKTREAALKAANGRKGQTNVRIVEVTA